MLNNLKSSEDSSAALGGSILTFMLNPDFFFFFFVKGSLSGWEENASVLLCRCQSDGSSI